VAVGLGDDRLPPDVDTAVYRIVQEALTNVAKHARATWVSVIVSRLESQVRAVVEDDGIGFDPAAAPKGRLGLMGMRERAEMVGGTFEIESNPRAGATVVISIPLGTS
jgi:signal transduction histidine kinase